MLAAVCWNCFLITIHNRKPKKLGRCAVCRGETLWSVRGPGYDELWKAVLEKAAFRKPEDYLRLRFAKGRERYEDREARKARHRAEHPNEPWYVAWKAYKKESKKQHRQKRAKAVPQERPSSLLDQVRAPEREAERQRVLGMRRKKQSR